MLKVERLELTLIGKSGAKETLVVRLCHDVDDAVLNHVGELVGQRDNVKGILDGDVLHGQCDSSPHILPGHDVEVPLLGEKFEHGQEGHFPQVQLEPSGKPWKGPRPTWCFIS